MTPVFMSKELSPMRGKFAPLTLGVLAVAAACTDAPTGATLSSTSSSPASAVTASGWEQIVITEGASIPGRAAGIVNRPVLSTAAGSVTSSFGGSSTTPLTILPTSCGEQDATVSVTFLITGRQANSASFKVKTRWEYNATSNDWAGSSEATVNVPARAAQDPTTVRNVTLTVVNPGTKASGTSSFAVVPYDVVTSGQAQLNADAVDVIVNVEFDGCEPVNTAPTLGLPDDFTVEATKPQGADVDFSSMVTVTDAEQPTGLSAICNPASGSTFALGTTTVSCSVTDNGNLSASGIFKITVVDETPPEFSGIPASKLFEKIATSSAGWAFTLAGLQVTVADVVDQNVSVSCTPAENSVIAMGVGDPASLSGGFGTPVSCTAEDDSGNKRTVSFRIDVGLNIASTAFLSPLRMTGPAFSIHKLGSTIPHKVIPPSYLGGAPAIDLDPKQLRLVMTKLDNSAEPESIEVNDYSAGSTEWRYDLAGYYIFNAKTGTKSPWSEGTWSTAVSYRGIPITHTSINLKK